jgi:hypothetical protein
VGAQPGVLITDRCPSQSGDEDKYAPGNFKVRVFFNGIKHAAPPSAMVFETSRAIDADDVSRRFRLALHERDHVLLPVCTESSNPDVVVMKSAKEGV